MLLYLQIKLAQAASEGGMIMTLEKAIELLKQEYDRASRLAYVKNPVAYALFQVWKKADKR